MSKQQLFNDVSNQLRNCGNPYGSKYTRGWGYINPNDSNERCAFASLTTERYAIISSIENKYNLAHGSFDSIPFVASIMRVFDYDPQRINDKDKLEEFLHTLAILDGLEYTTEETKKTEEIIVV
jgi:hypothetical protein